MFDWGFAFEVAGVGSGMVFAILGLLAVILWIVGKVIGRLEA